MNWLVLISGLFALFAVVGHFTIGVKRFFNPMMAASFDVVPKEVMHSVFHYVSVFMVLAAAFLLLIGFGVDFGGGTALLVRFIALNYSLFAVWQIVIALRSGIPGALTKLFQWTAFVLIALFAWLGA